jgi:ATP-dependent Zn protease
MSSYPEPLGPDTPVDNSRRKVVRTLLFWLLMILLAVVLFKMTSQSKDNSASRAMSYSEFMQQVEKDNVASGIFYMSQNTAEIRGNLHNPPDSFHATVLREQFTALTEQLRRQGANIEIAEGQSADWTTFLVNFAPLILLVAFWVFMMKRVNFKRAKDNTQAGDR